MSGEYEGQNGTGECAHDWDDGTTTGHVTCTKCCEPKGQPPVGGEGLRSNEPVRVCIECGERVCDHIAALLHARPAPAGEREGFTRWARDFFNAPTMDLTWEDRKMRHLPCCPDGTPLDREWSAWQARAAREGKP